MNALELRDNAKQQLAQIKTIESGVDYLNKVKAIEVWAKAEKKDAELQNMIAEQKIRTQRILGQLLKESDLDKGGGNVKNHQSPRTTSEKTNLSDFGITKDQSSTFQKIAALPEEIFESEIATAKEETNKRIELTTSRLLSAAKEYEKSKKAVQIKSKEYEPIQNIYFGDCLKHIKSLSDKSIDCVITDPPYGIDFQMNAYNNELSRKIQNDHSNQDALTLLSEVLNELKPKMKEDGQLYIFCSWQIYPDFAKIVSEYFDIHNLLIWNKMVMGMGDLKSNYGGMYEMIVFAGNKRMFNTRPGNIIDCKFTDERFHNTQKPINLIKTILEVATRENEFVYDPFLGSGSTAVAAKELNRSYGGSEIDEQNYKITLKRLNDVNL